MFEGLPLQTVKLYIYNWKVVVMFDSMFQTFKLFFLHWGRGRNMTELKNQDVSFRSTLNVSFSSELSVQSFFYFYEQKILQFSEASLIILHMYIYNTYLVIVLWRFSYTSENYKSDQGYENHLILKKTMVSMRQKYFCMSAF